MARVEMYTTPRCPYCAAGQATLEGARHRVRRDRRQRRRRAAHGRHPAQWRPADRAADLHRRRARSAASRSWRPSTRPASSRDWPTVRTSLRRRRALRRGDRRRCRSRPDDRQAALRRALLGLSRADGWWRRAGGAGDHARAAELPRSRLLEGSHPRPDPTRREGGEGRLLHDAAVRGGAVGCRDRRRRRLGRDVQAGHRQAVQRHASW